jgi:hypothetical protein
VPPRFTYWTILAGGLPTAFRAAERDELLPTFERLRHKHPDAEMKWFARGRLWSSPEEARDEQERTRAARGRDWRPGGEHRDPRQRFIDAKKARNTDRRRDRFERKQGAAGRPAPRDAEAPRDRPPPLGSGEGRRQDRDDRSRTGKAAGQRDRSGWPPRQQEGGRKPSGRDGARFDPRERPPARPPADRPRSAGGWTPRQQEGGRKPAGRDSARFDPRERPPARPPADRPRSAGGWTPRQQEGGR